MLMNHSQSDEMVNLADLVGETIVITPIEKLEVTTKFGPRMAYRTDVALWNEREHSFEYKESVLIFSQRINRSLDAAVKVPGTSVIGVLGRDRRGNIALSSVPEDRVTVLEEDWEAEVEYLTGKF